ncbi:MAG TPA: hypothetical protein VFZ02_01810 [Ktedonobacteraceae bacterium]
MNSILHYPAETELDIRCITNDTGATEDMYATTPLTIMRSLYRQSNEEELHSSFEEAISDRVLVLNRQLRRLSIPFTDNLSVQSPLSSVVKMPSLTARLTSLGRASRQAMLSLAIAFMLVMVGFDLMGLLVLYMRK